MAIQRDNPYGAFNFLVDLGTGETATVVAGFAEVTGLGLDVVYAEYRNGNERANTVRKIPGLYRVSNVVLRRGVIGSTDLFDWLKGVADGTPAPRDVTITLMDETRQPVASWRLYRAQPKRWLGPTLNAKGGDEVAIEELELVCEGIDSD